jgi:YD repeat-containing protein
VTNNMGSFSQYDYDSRDNVTRVTDPRGNITIHAYDGLSRLVSTTRQMTGTGVGGGPSRPPIVTVQT